LIRRLWPGTISAAYQQFHNYSIGNQLLAWSQCSAREIRRPMATYPKWRELGCHVKRGAKALTLCMPVTVKRTHDQEDGTEDADVFTGSSIGRIGRPGTDRRRRIAARLDSSLGQGSSTHSVAGSASCL
jgi:hypothetical protein